MHSAIFALTLLLQVATDSTPAFLSSFLEPVAPFNVTTGNAVFADVTVNSGGKVGAVSVTQGQQPFDEEAVRAIRQWEFVPSDIRGRFIESRVGVITIFRAPALYGFAVGGPSLGYKPPDSTQSDRPPIPKSISDPGYPVNSIASGVVALELKIDSNGTIDGVRVIRDIPSLTEFAKTAVQSWSFLPAMKDGSPVTGSVVVAVSFLRPVTPGASPR